MRRRGGAGERRGGPGAPTRPAPPLPAGRQRSANIWIGIWLTNGARGSLKGPGKRWVPRCLPAPHPLGGGQPGVLLPPRGPPTAAPRGTGAGKRSPLGSGKGRAGLRSWQASGEGLITGKTLIPQSGFSFLFL